MSSITPVEAWGVRDAPPSRLPPFHGTRPLKRWRYVAVFSEELMVCAARVQVGFFRQSFWAVLCRADGRLRERTRSLVRRGAVRFGTPVGDGPRDRAGGRHSGSCRLRVRDRGVLLDLALEEAPGIAVVCPHGGDQVWTRKQAGIPAHGTLALSGGAPRQIEALAVIDDTAGYHARHTEWWWSAGVGEGPDGCALAWNLVAGVNDPPSGSERAVWIGGEAHEAPPVSFASDLSRVRSQDGSELSFTPEAERRRSENLLIMSSDYRAPFGRFAGTLPGGIALARGLGVVEHHRARW